MADWSTISSMATAGGTMILAIATFASTRSANRAARTAEQAMLAGLRPLLLTSRMQDGPEKIMWGDEHFAKVAGGQAVLEKVGDVIYMATSLRNAGSGIAVLHGWSIITKWDPVTFNADLEPTPLDEYRRLTRDLYIPAGDTGFWQGAVRDPNDPLRAELAAAIDRRDRITLDLLYGDQEGGQRTITSFGFTWHPDAEVWVAGASRHWHLDRDDPR